VSGSSAVRITRDAESHLSEVLASLAACDEVVILDSGSGDRTAQIAEAAGVRWFSHPFDGFGPQKRRAVELASNDWVLAVDADEVLDGEAGRAIAGMTWDVQDPRDCWRLRRRPFVGRREIRHGHWVPDRVVRLFNRRYHTFDAAVIHEVVIPTGSVHILPGSLLHYSYADLAELFRADFHRLKAEQYRSGGRRSGPAGLTVRASWAFVHSLLLRRGFLDGPAGVVIALAAAARSTVGLALASEERVNQRER